MNCRKILAVMFVLCFAFCFFGMEAFAMNTVFSTSEIDPERQQKIISNIDLSYLSEEPRKNAIECFDVNENGSAAIGWEVTVSDEKLISVYDSAGVYQYGYSFHTLGSFGLGWDGDNVLIYFVRSGLAVSVDPTGNILELREIDDTPENNSYWYSVRVRQKIRGSDKYTVKNNTGISHILALDSSKLIKTDPAGNETIIYDAGMLNTTKFILGFAVFVSFFAIVIFSVAKETKAAIDKM